MPRKRDANGWLWCSKGEHYQPRGNFYTVRRRDGPVMDAAGAPALMAWCRECIKAYANACRNV